MKKGLLTIVIPVALITLFVLLGRQAESMPGDEGGALAPDFTLQTPAGEPVSLASFRGEKPVVLDFWASWCPNCRRDMPKLSRLYEQYGDAVAVIGINLQESPSVAQGYVDQAKIAFPIVLDPSGRTSANYGVRYTNTHVLIDRDGRIVRTIPGDISESHIRSLLP